MLELAYASPIQCEGRPDHIFGGICLDTLATGVVAAAGDLHMAVPMVVRMESTNVEAGRQILLDSRSNFTVGADMRDGPKGGPSGRATGLNGIWLD